MAAMRASAWAAERGSATPNSGRASESARKRVRRPRKSSSRGRGADAESAALLRDRCQPVVAERCIARTYLHRLALARWCRDVAATWRCGSGRAVRRCCEAAGGVGLDWRVGVAAGRLLTVCAPVDMEGRRGRN